MAAKTKTQKRHCIQHGRGKGGKRVCRKYTKAR